MTTPYLLTLLAGADTIVLYTGALEEWLKLMTTSHMSASSNLNCQIYSYLRYTVLALPAWLLLIITLERIIQIGFPFKVSSFCTRKNANMSLVAVTTLLCLLDIPMLVFVECTYHIVYDEDEVNYKIYAFCGYNFTAIYAMMIDVIIPFVLYLTITAHMKCAVMTISSCSDKLCYLSAMLLTATFSYFITSIAKHDTRTVRKVHLAPLWVV